MHIDAAIRSEGEIFHDFCRFYRVWDLASYGNEHGSVYTLSKLLVCYGIGIRVYKGSCALCSSLHPTNCSLSGRMYPSEELKELQAKIDEYEEHLQGTTDPADRTALLKVLASMREEKVLIMRGKPLLGHPASNPRPCASPFAVRTSPTVFLALLYS